MLFHSPDLPGGRRGPNSRAGYMPLLTCVTLPYTTRQTTGSSSSGLPPSIGSSSSDKRFWGSLETFEVEVPGTTPGTLCKHACAPPFELQPFSHPVMPPYLSYPESQTTGPPSFVQRCPAPQLPLVTHRGQHLSRLIQRPPLDAFVPG